MNAVETFGLTKYYGKVRGVEDVTLSVAQGDMFGFIGPNGAGKSTTIRSLLGLITPTSGGAKLLGVDIKRSKEALAKVGYLPSEAAFYHGMRVREILELSAKLRKKDCAAKASALCERLGLDPTRRVNELSLGNRKKVGIVCALQHEPELYVLDEPTSGLDPLIQRELYSILQERCEAGATVFLSSHVLSEVGRYCRHAGILRAGRLVACGSVKELVRTGVKRVTLQGAGELPQNEDIRDIKREEGSVSFLYGGTPGELIALLSAMKFEDMTVTDPELSEIFMHYYEGEGE